MTSPSNPRGISSTYWDNIGEGWRMDCVCGFITAPDPFLVSVAWDIEDHWADTHEVPS